VVSVKNASVELNRFMFFTFSVVFSFFSSILRQESGYDERFRVEPILCRVGQKPYQLI